MVVAVGVVVVKINALDISDAFFLLTLHQFYLYLYHAVIYTQDHTISPHSRHIEVTGCYISDSSSSSSNVFSSDHRRANHRCTS